MVAGEAPLCRNRNTSAFGLVPPLKAIEGGTTVAARALIAVTDFGVEEAELCLLYTSDAADE